MSSHHFVRENQEPGLYIDQWFDGAEVILEQLAQWAPKIIVHEQALDQVLTTGTKIDIVLYENEIKLIEEKTQFQFPIELKKSTSSLEENLKFITTNYIDRLHIICDIEPSNLIEVNGSKLTYYNSKSIFHTITSGFKKWIRNEETFQLLENENIQKKRGNNDIFEFKGNKAIFISSWTG